MRSYPHSPRNPLLPTPQVRKIEDMARPPTPLPPELGRIFTLDDARALGVSPDRLTRADIEHPFRRVYCRRTDPSGVAETEDRARHPDDAWRSRQRAAAQAYALVLPNGHFFSHATAAALWDLPVPSTGNDDLQVSCFTPTRATRTARVRAARLPAGSVSVRSLKGMPVADPASTWALAAADLDFDDAVALGDAVLHEPRIGGTTRLKRPPLATLAELRALVDHGRPRGASHLRALLPLLTPHSASPPESHLRLRLREWGFPQPCLDYDVRDDSGRFIGCSEFAWPEFKIAGEYEGDHHRTERKQWHRDIEKYQRYADAGWRVVQVTAELAYRRNGELRARFTHAFQTHGSGR